MAEVTGLVLPFFGLILLGFIAARITKQPEIAMGWLNTFIIYLALPALFFKLLAKTPIEQLASWGFVTANVSATFVIFALGFAIANRVLRSGIADSTIQGLAGAYGNIGYMGPGLAILTFGEKAAVPVALIFCFENIMHFTVAPTLMAIAGGNRDDEADGKSGGVSALIKGVVRRIVFHPFIIATAFGVAAAVLDVTPPLPVDRLIGYLAQAAAPCALFAMGVILALRPLKRAPVELTFIVPLKLLVHPVVMYVALGWAGDFDPVWVYTAVLLAALPTATNVFVIGQQYGVWVERASATILVTTVVSVLSVSALLYAITSGILPADLFPGSL